MDVGRPFSWSSGVRCLCGDPIWFVPLVIVIHLEGGQSEEPVNYVRREFCFGLNPGGVSVQARPVFDCVGDPHDEDCGVCVVGINDRCHYEIGHWYRVWYRYLEHSDFVVVVLVLACGFVIAILVCLRLERSSCQ